MRAQWSLWIVAFVLLYPVNVGAKEIFRDDFDSLDTKTWECRARCGQGLTCFAGCPSVTGGIATFSHHTYNPDEPGESTRCQEIRSMAVFPMKNELVVQSRVRLRPPVSSGLVGAFFLYTQKTIQTPDGGTATYSDEIDVELLTNPINRAFDNGPYCNPDDPGCEPYFFNRHPVVLAIYDDFQGQWDLPPHNWNFNGEVRDLNLTEWNTFRVHWRPHSVDWYWDRSAEGQADRLLATSVRVVPNEAMSVYFSFWASLPIWRAAWDPNLRPTAHPLSDVVSHFDVDWVSVSIPKLPPGDLDRDGCVDRDDAVVFSRCVSGPDPSEPPFAQCEAADLRADDHIDLADFAQFTTVLEGHAAGR